jgi:hypothetical protein
MSASRFERVRFRPAIEENGRISLLTTEQTPNFKVHYGALLTFFSSLPIIN